MDDNNEPAPENIPDGTTTESSNLNGKWGCNGQCHRKIMGVHNLQPRLNIVSGTHLDVLGYISMFLMFEPTVFFYTVIVKRTSDVLVHPLSMGEFLWFICILLVITRAVLAI